MQMEEKKQGSLLKKRWFWFLVVVFCVVFSIIFTPDGPVENQPSTPQKEVKVDPVQERMDRINELYADEPTFDKVQKLDGLNSIAIIFNETPDLGIEDSIDSITRGQAMNLSNEVNGVASVKTYVGTEAQMYCIATRGQVTECNDYR